MDLPEFKNHSEVVAFIEEMWRTARVRDGRGLERIEIESRVPDLRTEEELALAADCAINECPKKVFIDTRHGLCQSHQAIKSLNFIFSGISID